ncbi:MAG TPA: type II secretion system minor pseudopilin GspK [Xanthomonadales bacterium]|nr:type II secretion system minor pseudopilin GspK [Xanthomonadales bacterium]
MSRARQRGVALLIALLAVALGTIVLAMLLDAGGVALARTRNVARAAQADAYATGLEDWAIDLLRRDAAQDSDGHDWRGDIWARPLPPTQVPGGQIAGRMVDVGGCLNLNNLEANGPFAQPTRQRLQRLLRVLGEDPVLALAVVDWIDGDGMPELRGAEDPAYLAADPPYRAANRRFADASELRLVQGFDADTYAKVAPHVCALPANDVQVNVNTASLPVLMALDDAITEPVARRVAREGAAQYADTGQFQEALLQAGVQLPDLIGVGVRSQWFVARADIELDGLPMAYAALIERREGRYRIVSRNRAL